MFRLTLLALALPLWSVTPQVAQSQQPSNLFPPQRNFPVTPVRPDYFRNLTRPGFVPPSAGVYYYLPYWYVYDPFLVPIGPNGYYYPPSLYYPGMTAPSFNLPPQQQVPPAPQRENPPPPAKPEPPKKDDLDQQGEMYRLLRLGNRAFASGQYEDALKNYEKSLAVAPMEPHPAFHAAQALIALGQYHKAYTEIRRGLRWQPNWPESPFQPRALYGNKVATYQKHLTKLMDTVEKNPNDDSLLFLLGYQLWFDGKRAEAEVLFKRAAALTLDRTHIDRFLQVKDKP